MITPKQHARAGVLKSLAQLKENDVRAGELKKQACDFRKQLIVKRAQQEAPKVSLESVWDDLGNTSWIGPNGRYVATGAAGGLTLGMLYGAMKALCTADKESKGFGYNMTRYGLKGLVGGTGLGALAAGGSMLMTEPEKTTKYINSLPAITEAKAPKEVKQEE